MEVLCFDVGGSSIKYGLLNDNADILEKGSVPARTDSMEGFLSSVKEIYAQYEDRIEGVSFSMPGVIDPNTGYFYTGGAFDNFIHEINMIDVFSKFIHQPITIANDAKCAGYGELGYGCLKDKKDAVVMVLGTGIGGCLIKDREVLYGKHLLAGELSFINIHSSHSLDDLFAFRCGAPALNQRVKNVLNDQGELNGKMIFEMANNGEERVLKALHEFCYDIAMQMMNLQCIFDPEVFAVGGGISAQKLLFDEIDKCFDEIKEVYGNLFLVKPEVVACKYRNDANLVGALYLFVRRYAS